jgi:hypothetical protein
VRHIEGRVARELGMAGTLTGWILKQCVDGTASAGPLHSNGLRLIRVAFQKCSRSVPNSGDGIVKFIAVFKLRTPRQVAGRLPNTTLRLLPLAATVAPSGCRLHYEYTNGGESTKLTSLQQRPLSVR